MEEGKGEGKEGRVQQEAVQAERRVHDYNERRLKNHNKTYLQPSAINEAKCINK